MSDCRYWLARHILLAGLLIVLTPIVASSAVAAGAGAPSPGIADDRVEVTNPGKSVETGSSNEDASQTVHAPSAGSSSVPSDITYASERVCLQGLEENLNTAICRTVDATCDAEPSGVLVRWIAIDSSTTPPTETPTGDTSCLYPGSPAPEPPNGGEAAEPEVVITLEDFQSQPILAATIVSEPNNFGLLGGHNNFWADVDEQEFAFETLGDEVRIRAWPVAYDWNYGDGISRSTQTPGSAVAQADWLLVETPTSHVYGATGDYNLVLTTRFNGDYSVNGGPWIPIAGQAAVESEPHLISIWRSDNRLVDGTCAENPSAWGCS